MVEGIRVSGGGYQRLEDFCNKEARGSQLGYTVAGVNADDELIGLEEGIRVENAWLMVCWEYGWDALADLSYAEYCAAS